MKKIMFNDKYKLTEAVLSGRKTHTRRICGLTLHDLGGNQHYPERIFYQDGLWKFEIYGRLYHLPKENQPKYQVGEVVAIAQSYASIVDELENPKNFVSMEHWEFAAPKRGYYASFLHHPGWTNKMFVQADLMPHNIRFNDLWIERLQDISDEDCIKEGIGISATDNRIGYPIGIPFNYFVGEDKKGCRYSTPREAYAALIDKISGKGTWNRNPYVFAYEFELIK